ncbi:MAG: hypothetical protein JSR87_03855 [Proteobacteria bacterium]|nr:hypothetical protein [Pseudomonadota bacterium]MBS0572015.1 hypothetical protein [Pseudomonadota bacterium]
MNVRLHRLLTEAEAQLAPPDQARLAELVESFVATHTGPPDFDSEEYAHLALLDSEEFDPADPAEVAALLSRRA